ncbi:MULTISPECIES: LysR family transcriptional regulator [unclassified Mesorhizobium]|uniref:LysR family transcriptional regulator n=1 Tax=unclassified Mesorhizobium TaxID=325217 RepID=UPI000F75CDF2|nr:MULTISPECIES: LysR family transcriptional regulator [unclassified Mesorhizobium]AZO05126.1 LysR family transcriptional regulator [Mesorhizobium sp. M2A.F.Ca.ET.043.02.1.1]RWB42907.1 MAG: LysR family transcriptional regulator [Mesorhizobium sp.]RWB64910.1 MAG: LysR family transcriptional regulator [Mesorhizobium sp.]RWB88130.1 MAG: LysR family transcriptional regulator [Mesorhizobium sp.]RWD77334.1 MAG: LysR family transcriptional regulator [Mesorhizobium sp.]
MRRQIQLLTLDCALAVAEEGSFLGASRRTGIHHSALSRRIRDLEHALGTPIFERHPGGVRPTPAGASLLRDLRRVLSDLDGTLATAGAARGQQARSVTLGIETPAHITEFLDELIDFIRSAPNVSLRLVETNRAGTDLS